LRGRRRHRTRHGALALRRAHAPAIVGAARTFGGGTRRLSFGGFTARIARSGLRLRRARSRLCLALGRLRRRGSLLPLPGLRALALLGERRTGKGGNDDRGSQEPGERVHESLLGTAHVVQLSNSPATKATLDYGPFRRPEPLSLSPRQDQLCSLFGAYWRSDPRNDDSGLLAGDGQVTIGSTVMKSGARKIRKLHNDTILAGFAGSAADAFALFSRFESKLEQYRGNLERSVVELARDWRSDRVLRRLEAMLIVADRKSTFLVSGTGDLIEPDDGVVAVGSGGPFALAAARALVRHSSLDARQVAEEAMRIAADICIYTNPQLTIEEL
jgi:ATP-dependent HslUV protease subunit HslV